MGESNAASPCKSIYEAILEGSDDYYRPFVFHR